jgi:hypothetical protein
VRAIRFQALFDKASSQDAMRCVGPSGTE